MYRSFYRPSKTGDICYLKAGGQIRIGDYRAPDRKSKLLNLPEQAAPHFVRF